MDKLLTICTAAYNVEPYVAKMLDSLIASKYRECLEIIVVNDGSTDNTQVIVEKYVQSYPGIVILVNKKNGGSGSARNVAFSMAKGKYLKLIDADDWVDTTNFDIYIEKLKHIDVDVIWNGFYMFIKDKHRIVECNHWSQFMPNRYYKFDEEMLPMPSDIMMHGVTYKTILFKEHGIKLSEGMSYVDTEYLAYPIPYIRTGVYIDSPFYVYQVGLTTQSINSQRVIENHKKIKILVERLLRYYENKRNEMHTNNLQLMKVVLAKAYTGLYSSYLYQKKIGLQEEVVALDQQIKMQDEEIWKLVPQLYGEVGTLRKFHYKGYYLVLFLRKFKDYLKGIWLVRWILSMS